MNYIKIILLLLIAVSCKKKQVPPTEDPTAKLTNCILVLNEGLFQQNNASVSKINLNSLEVNNLFFEEKTQRPLGDTGNDMQIFDNKIFIVMNVSSTIEVLNAQTGQSIKQIVMVENGVPKQPRYITFNGDKAFISCYDGFVDVLDLTSLSITKRIPVGANPEQLVISNNKLYVANSGGLNFPNVDSTISVISLSSESEISKITIGKNPGPLCVDDYGDVYAISRGDFSSIPSRMHRISSISDSKVGSFNFDADGICKMNNDLIINYTAGGVSKLLRFDTQNETVINSDFIDLSYITTFYGVKYSQLNDKLYCFDANGYVNMGYVNEYNSNGTFTRKFKVGLIPNNVLIYE